MSDFVLDKHIYVGATMSINKTIVEENVRDFAEMTGDFNPVHIDETAARNSRFGKRICHGMLVASYISTVLGMYLPGPGTIYLNQTMEFLLPTYIGDTITASVTVTEIKRNIITLDTIVLNQEQEHVIDGKAVVMIEK